MTNQHVETDPGPVLADHEGIDNDSTPAELPRFTALRQLGNRALWAAGVAGASLALIAASPAKARADGGVEVPVPPGGQITRPLPFEMGIATYNSLTDDAPNFFADEQALGLNGDREALMRPSWRRDLSVIQEEDPEAQAYGIDQRAVNIGDTATAPRASFVRWAGHIVPLLPADIHRIIPENEVDNKEFYNPGGDKTRDELVEDYVDELHGVFTVVKAERPDIQVCGFGLSSIPSDHPVKFFQQAAFYALIKYGGLQNIEDCLSVHLYLSIPKDEQLLEAYEGITGQPIWVDEFGRNLENGLTPTEQAAQYSQFITDLYNDPQIMGVNTYHMEDPPVNSPTDPFQTGLKTPGGVWLPSAHAERRLASSYVK